MKPVHPLASENAGESYATGHALPSDGVSGIFEKGVSLLTGAIIEILIPGPSGLPREFMDLDASNDSDPASLGDGR